MGNRKLILTYELNKKDRRLLESLAAESGIRTKPVTPSQYRQPLGGLCGIQGIQAARQGFDSAGPLSSPNAGCRTAGHCQTASQPKPMAPVAFPEPLLVFSGIDRETLDAFLLHMRKAGCLTGCLKAVLTPTNIFWDSVQLYEELGRERRAIPPAH